MSSKKETYTGLSQDESDRMQRYLKEISRIYGIRMAEIGDFLEEKKTQGPCKGEHRWFMAFQIIDSLFDEMIARILIALKPLGIAGSSKGMLIKSITREIQERVKEELPLPKIDMEKDSS